jgi:ATP-dependent Clp protease ATP-binding subunit ClpC
MSRLTPGASMAWQIAALETDGAGYEHIERAHLLIGVLSLEKFRDAPPSEMSLPPDLQAALRQEIGRIDETLRRAGAEATWLRRRLREVLGNGPAARGRRSISRSDGCKKAFLQAGELAQETPLSALHLLGALAAEPDALLTRVFGERGIDAGAIREAALGLVRPPAVVPVPVAPTAPAVPRAVAPGNAPSSDTPELDRYGRDLTRLAREGALGPVVGRREVLLEILRTLARESKSNPLLVGEAGVGKTALVEALALRAAAGKDAAVLGGRRIVELNVGALLAGTQYRGEFEERVTKILDEVRGHPEILIFIDELHTIVGAGRTGQGAMDAANLLKPALARGDFRCIGATTPEEYRRYIEPDAALERRFARVNVPEPGRDEAIEILRGRCPQWERHHGVVVEADALEAAVDLSIRFDPDLRLPDKAIDLIDKAASRARVPMLSVGAPSVAAPASSPVRVTAPLVAEVLAEKRGLPVELVRASGQGGARLLQLEGFLRERIIGQDEALARVAQRLRLAHSGLQESKGPLAVLLFLGPTGVGKTETARALAEFLFGRPSDVTRFDMSELMEEHSVSKLIGAPPGYVGHDEEGQLTGAIRAQPYSVVLLDEVEKAHPRVLDVLLQLFDDGRLTDSKGRTADARHAVFVMTSNLGSGADPEAVVGFGTREAESASDAALSEARRFFRPELLNRIDEVIAFRALDGEALRRIARPMLQALASRVRERHGVELIVSPEAEEFLARAGFSAEQGAREMDRTIERLVQAPLSGLVLSGKLSRHAAWSLVYDEGGVYLLPA